MKDLIIIGAGPGGFDTALFAAKKGLDVLLIEKSHVGGTCLNYGCIPTKALYHNAKNIKNLQSMNDFGINIDSYTLDYHVVKERKESIVSNQIKNIERTLSQHKIEVCKGEASISDPHTVLVGEKQYQAKYIIIATGSSPRMIPFKGDHLEIVHHSKDLLSLEEFPKKMLVVGAGVIGSEMASIFNQFDCDVSLIEYQDEILPPLDHEIKKRARNLYKRQGIKVMTKASLKEVREVDGSYVAFVEQKGKLLEMDTDYILVSTGRSPNFGGIELEKLSIDYNAKGIIVNEHKETSCKGIYAIGDVNGEMMLAHKATYDGYKAVSHIIKEELDINFNLVPSVVFTFPEIASVGKTEEELSRQEYRKSKFMFKTNAKAQCLNETEGFVKVLVDENDILVGCHIIGPHASDLIHEASALMNLRANMKQIKTMIHAHPTITEVLSEALKDL